MVTEGFFSLHVVCEMQKAMNATVLKIGEGKDMSSRIMLSCDSTNSIFYCLDKISQIMGDMENVSVVEDWKFDAALFSSVWNVKGNKMVVAVQQGRNYMVRDIPWEIFITEWANVYEC